MNAFDHMTPGHMSQIVGTRLKELIFSKFKPNEWTWHHWKTKYLFCSGFLQDF